MVKLLLFALIIFGVMQVYADNATSQGQSQAPTFKPRNGLSAGAISTWQQIFSDASLYGGASIASSVYGSTSSGDVAAVNQTYQSLSLNTLEKVASIYNNPALASYTPGLARLREVINRINNQAYPAN